MKRILWKLLVIISLTGLWSPTFAYEHQHSLVEFEEYTENIIVKNKKQNKPYFLLFSAEWCHWCHEFSANTLVRNDVSEFLNQNFVNIFIDVDIHNSAYVEYRATGLPFTVFLNPDGSLYYKYTGTLYGDDFMDVVQEVVNEVGVGKYALGMESSPIQYQPPKILKTINTDTLQSTFLSGVLDNFDTKAYGLGKGQKSIQPRTFAYLIEKGDQATHEQSLEWISKTLEQAVDHIYDPIEGGFFRYAEKRNWQIPHYEKFGDLNAGTVLLLYQVNKNSPSAILKKAADKTLGYLNSTLYHPETGAFLSFQIADTSYYFLSENHRKNIQSPKVMNKIFVGRLAATLSYLIQLSEYNTVFPVRERVRQSLNFLAQMIMEDKGMKRYYALTEKQWLSQSGLSDYAYVAKLFTEAAAYYQDTRYTAVATKVVRSTIANFYDDNAGIFVDPAVDNRNVEYLMELNGLIAQAMVVLNNRVDSDRLKIVESIITYFSQMSEVLEDRFWDAVDWDFTEAYIPYLHAIDAFSSTQEAISTN